jgi:thiosulfate/3-mercaptopyruvate sulfurtransferase
MASMQSELPLFIEADQAEAFLDDENTVFVDLCKPDLYARLHVPRALSLGYGQLIKGVRPATGLLPPVERLNQLVSRLGIHSDSRVFAYDDEGGGCAARLAWTLHVMGFFNVSVINGGIHAWANEGHRITDAPSHAPSPGSFQAVDGTGTALAVKDYVKARVDVGDSQLFDSRTADEYTGARAFASRGGHIPGAINLNWVDTMDPENNLRLKPVDTLLSMLERLGFEPEREIITYCQTHHRSSHSYLMLKHLGFTHVRGYAGAWAEWGNDPSLPVATGFKPG